MIFFDGIIYRFRPHGGISQIYRQLWKRWEQVEQDAIVFVPNGQVFFEKKRLTWHYSSGLKPRRFFWNIEMKQVLKKNRPDLFISTYYTRPHTNTPEILFVYDMIYERFMNQSKQEQSFIEKKKELIQRAAKIITISESTKQDILQFYAIPEQRIQVIHLAAAEQFKPPNSREGIEKIFPRPYILYVGRRSYYKNFSALLGVYVNNSKIHQDFDLVVVDKETWRKDELEKIVSFGLQDRIHLLNNISDQDLPKYYQQARVFVFPSRYEGFGIPMLEAFACGTPVIANKTSSLVEIGGNAPLYFSETDGSVSLSQQLEKVCFDDQLCNELSAKGFNQVTQFSWDKFTTEFKRITDEI